MNGNLWTGAELDLLRKLWPLTPWPKIELMFPRHTHESITRKARDLGVRRRRTKRAAKVRILRELRAERAKRNNADIRPWIAIGEASQIALSSIEQNMRENDGKD